MAFVAETARTGRWHLGLLCHQVPERTHWCPHGSNVLQQWRSLPSAALSADTWVGTIYWLCCESMASVISSSINVAVIVVDIYNAVSQSFFMIRNWNLELTWPPLSLGLSPLKAVYCTVDKLHATSSWLVSSFVTSEAECDCNFTNPCVKVLKRTKHGPIMTFDIPHMSAV